MRMLCWSLMLAALAHQYFGHGLELREALIAAVTEEDWTELNYTLVLRIEGRIPLKYDSEVRRDNDVQLGKKGNTPINITFSASTPLHPEQQAPGIARVYTIRTPIVEDAYICVQAGFPDGPTRRDKYFLPVYNSTPIFKMVDSNATFDSAPFLGGKEPQSHNHLCVFFSDEIRVVGLSFETITPGYQWYNVSVDSAGRYPRCKVFDNQDACLTLSKNWNGLKCGWTQIVTDTTEGFIGRCHDDFTSKNAQQWCDNVCKQ
mmetsp:Transcript_5116/g.11267  ORF Transcript_5116/g.11267 Transcript_5116/m.11267 type:complete len:260 (+) Transcript_5116:272-1051(+)